LDVPVDEIQERIGSLKERGVVSNGKHNVEEIFADRDRLYRKYADITYSQRNNMLRESVEELCQIIRERMA
jgi:shikimate kinase